jgi:dCMP deaminase
MNAMENEKRPLHLQLDDKWDQRYLAMAKLVASWSKDPSTGCGAVIVRPDRSLVSVGFNGFPKRLKDDPQHYHDRPTKLSRMAHSEANAIRHARERIVGYTVYSWPMLPCDRCANQLINYEIDRIVCTPPPASQAERWADSFESTRAMCADAGVILDIIQLRD